MPFIKAIFREVNGVLSLLCNECGAVIKTENEFDPMEIAASIGNITMTADYCDKHKYKTMYGDARKRELLRKGIQEKLREGIMEKNLLNVKVTRPTQELIIMRGIPGSGKSTKAKSLVQGGVIHSTDDLIEATGDYNAYFKKMVDSGDWSEHGRMHHRNFLNAKKSMEEGISPVIIDNTNIKASEPKKYVEEALKLGLSESNIKIVDVGDGGCTAEELAERNTHNVPLKTIERMMASHKSVGELTVEKILGAKGGLKESKTKRVIYSGVMLDGRSKNDLITKFCLELPEGWKIFCHHMTTTFMKPLENREDIGKEVELTATHIGVSDMALAVRVEGYPTTNKIPHVTLAVNVAEGGKPVMSNNITDWSRLDTPIKLYGTLEEVMG